MLSMMTLAERARNFFVNNIWLIFLLWSLWLTFEYFGFGPFSYVKLHDFGNSTFPMRLGLIGGLFENGLTHWFPSVACGVDRLSITQLNIFQIDSLFYLSLPAWLAQGLVVFLQRFLAGYFTYRLCKDCLKLSELISLAAGVVYSMSFFYFQTQFGGEAGFPFILWSLERISENKNATRYILAFLLGLFVSFSSSFPLSIPFILPMALAWFVLVRRQYSFRFLSLFIVFSATVLAGKIPVIWALLVNAPLSQRADWVPPFFLRWMGWGYEIYFITILGYVVGIFGLYWSRLRERNLLMVMALLVFCGIGASLFALIPQHFDIGFLSGYNFARFALLVPFFAAMALAYGLHLLSPSWVLSQDSPHNGTKYHVQTILCIIVIGSVVISSFGLNYKRMYDWGGGRSYALNYENPDVQSLASSDVDSAPFRVATIRYRYLCPAYANAYGLETVDGYIVLYPQRYKDFWGKVIEPLTSKDKELYHVFYEGGNHIYLFSPSDGAFDKIEKVPFSQYYNLNLLSLANTKYLISQLPVTNEHLTLLPSQFPGVKGPRPPLSLKTIVQGIKYNVQGRHVYIYENELCFPRFFLSGKIMVFENSDELLEAMARADTNSLRNNVFIEEKFLSKIDAEKMGFTRGEIRIEQYSPDSIILSVNLDNPGILVISNSYNPYWISKVNGVGKDIFPAYHTFMGIFLEEGESRVELEYRPPYWAFP